MSVQTVRFDQICKNISSRIDDPKQADTDYYVGLEHLDSEEPRILRHGSPKDVVSSKFHFKCNNILFGRRRVYLKKLAIAKRDGICSTDIYVLEPKLGKIIQGFLPIFMQSEEFYNRTIMLSAGSLSPRVKWKQIINEEFLIPSIKKQEILVQLINQIDYSISKSQNLVEKTKHYAISRRESLLTKGIGHTKFKKVKWLYGKTIEIPEEWTLENLSKICKIWKSNSINSNLYIGLEHIEQGTGRLIGRGNARDFISTKHVFQKNNVLYGKLRPLLKKVWVATEDGCCSTDILSLQTNKKTTSTMLSYILLTTKLLTYAVSTSAGTKMPRTSWDDLRNFKTPLPPIPEQKQIVSILSNIEQQITQQQSHISNLKTMRKSMLNSKLTMEKIIVQ